MNYFIKNIGQRPLRIHHLRTNGTVATQQVSNYQHQEATNQVWPDRTRICNRPAEPPLHQRTIKDRKIHLGFPYLLYLLMIHNKHFSSYP